MSSKTNITRPTANFPSQSAATRRTFRIVARRTLTALGLLAILIAPSAFVIASGSGNTAEGSVGTQGCISESEACLERSGHRDDPKKGIDPVTMSIILS